MKRMASSSSQRKKKLRKAKHDQEVPHDIAEEIILRLPVKSIIRFKIVSKQWRSIIESLCFKESHLRFSEQSNINNPNILAVSIEHQSCEFKTMYLNSISLHIHNLFYTPLQKCAEVSESCDGLICIYDLKYTSVHVVNPATRWLRKLPKARFQQLMGKATYTRETLTDITPMPRLAFAKTASSDYKLVWLYNSDKYNSDDISPNEGFVKCEVFDFRENAWKYLACTPSYRIFNDQTPVSTNGLVYWVTERYDDETKVIVLDLKTEIFRLLPNNPCGSSHPDHIDLCILDNNLCMSKRKRGTMIQKIWRLSSDNDTWVKIYTIDLSSCFSWSTSGMVYFTWIRKDVIRPCTPVAICKNKEILLTHRYGDGLVKYNPQTKTYSLFHKELDHRRVVPYFESLISHI